MNATNLPNRRSIRLRGYDYAQRGAYFVSICTSKHLSVFGEILDGEMHLSPIGQVVDSRWEDLPNHTLGLSLDAWVVMPNHVHGIIILPGTAELTPDSALQRGPAAGSLGRVVGGFKSAVSREVAARNLTLVSPLWQRSYHERIVRNDRELDTIRKYIHDNPSRWEQESDHPWLHAVSGSSSHV